MENGVRDGRLARHRTGSWQVWLAMGGGKAGSGFITGQTIHIDVVHR
jgi:hypothetical protein